MKRRLDFSDLNPTELIKRKTQQTTKQSNQKVTNALTEQRRIRAIQSFFTRPLLLANMKLIIIVALALSTAIGSLAEASDEAASNRNLRASNPTTLCIYSKLAEGDNCSWSKKKEVGYGHAALSVTRRGETTTYGLWPDATFWITTSRVGM